MSKAENVIAGDSEHETTPINQEEGQNFDEEDWEVTVELAELLRTCI